MSNVRDTTLTQRNLNKIRPSECTLALKFTPGWEVTDHRGFVSKEESFFFGDADKIDLGDQKILPLSISIRSKEVGKYIYLGRRAWTTELYDHLLQVREIFWLPTYPDLEEWAMYIYSAIHDSDSYAPARSSQIENMRKSITWMKIVRSGRHGPCSQ